MSDLTALLSKEDLLAQDRVRNDLNAVIDTPQGRRTIQWILSMCGMYRSCFNADLAITSFSLGERNIGLRIVSEMNEIDPRIYPRMLLDTANELERIDGDETYENDD